MDNSIVFLLLAFFLCWLCEGLGLLFARASLEFELKTLWKRILKNLDKELKKNA